MSESGFFMVRVDDSGKETIYKNGIRQNSIKERAKKIPLRIKLWVKWCMLLQRLGLRKTRKILNPK